MNRIVADRLRAPGGAAEILEVAAGSDDICAPCPHRRGPECENRDRVAALDARHASALGLRAGDRLRWSEALARMRAGVKPGDLARLCAGCRWLESGLCEAALNELHRK